ncbi:hypothetical protein PFMG_01847 [Plasmodium falciparum IGH-CR14]|uniref:Uncharacterized protein n=1 Tax=Plasmodium falciparum IGH-CR14 TaxID=580059 RepID=A0A0L1I7X3_PLAFA|nr:hypothetical protein PFMG_01847 [Plasmodium falciparum IGH-CR14]
MYTNNFYISNILKNFQSSSISLMNMHIKTITLFIILLDNKKMNTYSNIIKYTKSTFYILKKKNKENNKDLLISTKKRENNSEDKINSNIFISFFFYYNIKHIYKKSFYREYEIKKILYFV